MLRFTAGKKDGHEKAQRFTNKHEGGDEEEEAVTEQAGIFLEEEFGVAHCVRATIFNR